MPSRISFGCQGDACTGSHRSGSRHLDQHCCTSSSSCPFMVVIHISHSAVQTACWLPGTKSLEQAECLSWDTAFCERRNRALIWACIWCESVGLVPFVLRSHHHPSWGFLRTDLQLTCSILCSPSQIVSTWSHAHQCWQYYKPVAKRCYSMAKKELFQQWKVLAQGARGNNCSTSY